LPNDLRSLSSEAICKWYFAEYVAKGKLP